MDSKPFEFFNEIGIISQLNRAALETRLPHGLLITHFGVLNHIMRLGDGPTPLELARAFQTPKTSMTHTLAGLAKHGLVEMKPNPDDGRSKRVWITDAGRQVRNDAIAKIGQDFSQMFGHIPADYFDDVIPKLREMRILLDENRD